MHQVRPPSSVFVVLIRPEAGHEIRDSVFELDGGERLTPLVNAVKQRVVYFFDRDRFAVAHVLDIDRVTTASWSP